MAIGKKWGPVFVWAGMIFFLSSQRLPPPKGNLFFDVLLPNFAHFFEYFVLFALVWRANHNIFFSFLFSLFYAFSDEYHQSFVPTRSPSLADVFVDFLGMVFSYLSLWKLLPILPTKPRNWVKNLLTV